MSAIETCRTAALGGHVEACEDCGHRRIAYNSCRNRHGPNARVPRRGSGSPRARPTCCRSATSMSSSPSGRDRRHRLAQQSGDLRSPVPAASETMITVAADPKHLAPASASPPCGTWGSAMTHHPHLHMTCPAAASRSTVSGGSGLADPASCCPSWLSRLFRRLCLTGAR